MRSFFIAVLCGTAVLGCKTLDSAGAHSSTVFKTDVTNNTQKSICQIDLVNPPSTIDPKERITTTKLEAPIKAGETKSVTLNLNIGAASPVRIYDCEKTANKIAEATIAPDDQRKLTVP